MKPLSFIIITYNRPADMLALVDNIARLERAQELLEEVIIVNNGSTEDYSQTRSYIEANPQIPFRYFDAPGNLGVARGRNYALAKGTAPLIIMLDDDAEMGNADCLPNLLAEFGRKDTEREKAIVSFKVLYYSTGEMQPNALPHKQFEQYKDKSFFETYYYAGGAHAIRRSVLEEVGNYPEDFFYGMEEYDLSYRILNAGYCIVYTDSVVMLHKESPLGRKPKKEKLRMMWVNKTKVAGKYLPAKYFWSTSLAWSAYYLKNTGLDLAGFIRGWKEVFHIKPVKQASPATTRKLLAYLRSLGACISY